MAQLTAQEFEALWQDAQKGPVVREAAVRPIQLDMSLAGALDRYGTIADSFLAQGKISKVDHDTLMAAIATLKAVLIAINEKELIAQHIADTTKTVQQQVQDKINTLLAAPGTPR
jgi:hypothetical protein